MKNIAVSALAVCILLACSQDQPATAQTSTAPGESPKMKMTTDIPVAITTPDTVETRIGTLESSNQYHSCAFRRIRPLIPIASDHLFRQHATTLWSRLFVVA